MRWVYAQILVLLLSVLPWGVPQAGRAPQASGWTVQRQTPPVLEARLPIVEPQPSARLEPALPWNPLPSLTPLLAVVASLGVQTNEHRPERAFLTFQHLQLDGP